MYLISEEEAIHLKVKVITEMCFHLIRRLIITLMSLKETLEREKKKKI